MEKKVKTRIRRKELVSRLYELAGMIESGEVEIGDVATAVPDDLEYELELEENHDEGKLEIEIKWHYMPYE